MPHLDLISTPAAQNWAGAPLSYAGVVPKRELASLMGHDVKTHQKHYGQWTTDEDTKESVLRAVDDLAGTPANQAVQPMGINKAEDNGVGSARPTLSRVPGCSALVGWAATGTVSHAGPGRCHSRDG